MLSDPKFLPLKNMDLFTEEMFNQIIAFQEKQHPAWNNQLSFDQRIKDLPLHYFIFSNPDRDPEKFGPTVAHYYPLRSEIQRLAYYIKHLGSNPKVCDVFPGNGLIGSLLAREHINVIGLTNLQTKPYQIVEFYDPQYYKMSELSMNELACDVMFASWPPPDADPTAELTANNPKLIIYTFTEHINADTGQRQVGSNTMLGNIPNEYQLIDQWTVTRPENILHAVWPDMTPSIEEVRHTHIYASKQAMQQLNDLPTYQFDESAAVYDWEKELKMTELALEAKQLIESLGISV